MSEGSPGETAQEAQIQTTEIPHAPSQRLLQQVGNAVRVLLLNRFGKGVKIAEGTGHSDSQTLVREESKLTDETYSPSFQTMGKRIFRSDNVTGFPAYSSDFRTYVNSVDPRDQARFTEQFIADPLYMIHLDLVDVNQSWRKSYSEKDTQRTIAMLAADLLKLRGLLTSGELQTILPDIQWDQVKGLGGGTNAGMARAAKAFGGDVFDLINGPYGQEAVVFFDLQKFLTPQAERRLRVALRLSIARLKELGINFHLEDAPDDVAGLGVAPSL